MIDQTYSDDQPTMRCRLDPVVQWAADDIVSHVVRRLADQANALADQIVGQANGMIGNSQISDEIGDYETNLDTPGVAAYLARRIADAISQQVSSRVAGRLAQRLRDRPQ